MWFQRRLEPSWQWDWRESYQFGSTKSRAGLHVSTTPNINSYIPVFGPPFNLTDYISTDSNRGLLRLAIYNIIIIVLITPTVARPYSSVLSTRIFPMQKLNIFSRNMAVFKLVSLHGASRLPSKSALPSRLLHLKKLLALILMDGHYKSGTARDLLMQLPPT